jgi:adenylosuccinate lyase
MGEQSFQTLLSDDPRVAAHISADEVNALLDPTAYTGRCAAIADEQADRADALAAELLK